MNLLATILVFIGICLISLSIFDFYKNKKVTEKFFDLITEGLSVISVASVVLFFLNQPNAIAVLYVMPILIVLLVVMKKKIS